jgi:hypothetical protein
VKRSTTTKTAVKFLESGSCSIKSIEIDSQGWSGIGSCWSCFTFDLAQVVQICYKALDIGPSTVAQKNVPMFA